MLVYQCEDSIEGIFTAIYRIYEDKNNNKECRISTDEELFLFAEYIRTEPDRVKTVKVIRTLQREFGEEDYLRICYALASEDAEKATAVYESVAYGLQHKVRPGHLFDNLAKPFLHKVFSLARSTGNEVHHLQGFIRFRQEERGFLYAPIGPKNNVLTFLMPHFADRLPGENFIIYDEKRGIFGVHPAFRQWYLVQQQEDGLTDFEETAEEGLYSDLFRHFCNSIAIKERRNLKLQRSLLPLRFREYMVEFGENPKGGTDVLNPIRDDLTTSEGWGTMKW